MILSRDSSTAAVDADSLKLKLTALYLAKMPSYTPTQKGAIQQFVGFTQAKESVAAKHLKSHGWNIELAINAYFASSNSSSPAAAVNGLNATFNKYRDNPKDDPDAIGVEGSMRYLGDLGVSLEDPLVLVLLTELNAPTMGEIKRDGFLEGWKKLRAFTLQDQKSALLPLRASLSNPNTDAFTTTYRHTFTLALSTGSRSLPLDAAIEYWRLLFSPPSSSWNTPTTPWLDYWLDYLQERWKRAVSKDMWNQTLSFVRKSLEEEGMGWWSEEGAWPGVLDEFVGYVREKRGEGGKMEL